MNTHTRTHTMGIPTPARRQPASPSLLSGSAERCQAPPRHAPTATRAERGQQWEGVQFAGKHTPALTPGQTRPKQREWVQRPHAGSPENRADRGCFPRGSERTGGIPNPGGRLAPASGDEAPRGGGTPRRAHPEEPGLAERPGGSHPGTPRPPWDLGYRRLRRGPRRLLCGAGEVGLAARAVRRHLPALADPNASSERQLRVQPSRRRAALNPRRSGDAGARSRAAAAAAALPPPPRRRPRRLNPLRAGASPAAAWSPPGATSHQPAP